MRQVLILIAIIHANLLIAQSELSAFENLVGSKWEVVGKWSNGEDFRQEYLFEWSLDKKLIKVQTFGTTNMLTGEYGLRNEGIRFWKENEEVIKFYEFDIFGGITEGVCTIDSNSIIYDYVYEGLTFRDSWIFKDLNTYQYVVENLENGERKELYQTSTITRKE
ncbi:MAG: hypothetical protein ABJG78_13390 [Cyclobacteriaceae bacterium]